MPQTNLPFGIRNWWRNALAAMLSLLLLGRAAEAVDDTFYNDGYYNSENNINATNFLNDSGGVFSINYLALNANWPLELYRGWYYTQNFSNYGEMDSDTGFWFDTQNSGHSEASSFNNTGSINCDTNGAITNLLINVNLVPWGGGLYVFATNVVNSGTITVGPDGLARFFGNNIDLTRGNIGIESGTAINSGFFDSGDSVTYPDINATGQTGTDTNDDFDPSFQLTQTNASSGILKNFFVNLYGQLAFNLALTNTTSYFATGSGGPSNVIVWAVFLENDNTNVTANVYFSQLESAYNGCISAGAFGHIEWIGSYLSPTTGAEATSYLYLDNDFVQGSSTNILNYFPPGVPCNFNFTETNSQFSYGVGPATASFPPFFGNSPFPPGNVTNNIYSFVNAQFIPISYATNNTLQLTNLPGRIEITASNELNLSQTSISGENYLLLKSTNQFDYDGESLISSPYSDIYLGTTNGSFALTNAILPYVPIWNGTVQAWNTRWLYTDTNPADTNGTIPMYGVTYDFRVLLVGSAISPTTPSQEKDLMLYGTNNITISDTMNVFGNFSINCTNLTLTTNGGGADSLDGELNLNSGAITWATSLPRLRCLTNNGAIRTATGNVVDYGSVTTPYLAMVNAGVISNGSGSTIVANDFENYGSFTAGNGSFALNSQTTTMSNATVAAGGTFTNTGNNVIIGGTQMAVGKSVTLVATNLLTDANSTNGNIWSLGSRNGGSGFATGLVLPIKPATGDLLDTIITNIAPSGTAVTNVWSGKDYGQSNSGFTNNAAIGWLCLDSLAQTPRAYFGFSGTGVSNAIYVDCLELRDFATNANAANNALNPTNLVFNTNLVIYYAQAIISGQSAAIKLDHGDNNHLRWVATYAGRFSSTNIVYPNGTTNVVNAALAGANNVDSDGDGVPNSTDPTPFFVSSQVKPAVTVTNVPPKKIKVSWYSIPGATNYVSYRTNLLLSTWQPLTNFVSPTGSISPTNLTLLDAFSPTGVRFYQVQVVPNNALYFPPGY